MILAASVGFGLQNLMSLHVDLLHMYYVSKKNFLFAMMNKDCLIGEKSNKNTVKSFLIPKTIWIFYFREKKTYHKAFFLSSLSLQSLLAQNHPASWLYMQIQKQYF